MPVKGCFSLIFPQNLIETQNDRPRSSKYPPTSLRVISYEQPKLLSGEEEVEEVTLKVKKMKKSRSCPTSPFPTSSAAKSDFASQPASPNSNFPSFLVDMDEDEVTYTGRKSKKRRDREESFGESFETIENKKTVKKKAKKMQMKERKRASISEKLEEGKSRAEVLEDILEDHQMTKKNVQQVKKMKHLIRDCDQKRKADRAMEFQERRGFKKSSSPHGPGLAWKGNWEGEQEGKRQSKREEKITRAALIPTSVQVHAATHLLSSISTIFNLLNPLQAACKFLKKEAQKVTMESSELGKRLQKDLKQEIFGLKHGLHAAPRLKKVERKRLADLVINLRNHA